MCFCNFPGHTAFSCFIKNNIALIIDGDEFVELLHDTCLSKVNDSDQCGNIVCKNPDT